MELNLKPSRKKKPIELNVYNNRKESDNSLDCIQRAKDFLYSMTLNLKPTKFSLCPKG